MNTFTRTTENGTIVTVTVEGATVRRTIVSGPGLMRQGARERNHVMRTPPTIYRPEPIPSPPAELGEPAFVLFGRVHKAHRVDPIGWRLDCGGRIVRYGRCYTLSAEEAAKARAAACARCFPS